MEAVGLQAGGIELADDQLEVRLHQAPVIEPRTTRASAISSIPQDDISNSPSFSRVFFSRIGPTPPHPKRGPDKA